MCRKLLQLIWVCAKCLLGCADRHSPNLGINTRQINGERSPLRSPLDQAPDQPLDQAPDQPLDQALGQALDQAKLSNCVAFLDQFADRGIDAATRELVNL